MSATTAVSLVLLDPQTCKMGVETLPSHSLVSLHRSEKMGSAALSSMEAVATIVRGKDRMHGGDSYSEL